MNASQNDVFISYNWNIKDQVRQLYDILTNEFKYKVWLDEKKLNAGNRPLTAELADAIKNSKVIICCITKDYCKSYNCNLELEFASNGKKEMVVLMVEKLDTTEIHKIQVTDRNQTSGIGFIIT